MKPLIKVSVAEDELDGGVPPVGPALSRLLDEELVKFEAWVAQHLKGPLTSLEKAAVKTYLYQKIVGRVDQLETHKIDGLGLIAKTG